MTSAKAASSLCVQELIIIIIISKLVSVFQMHIYRIILAKKFGKYIHYHLSLQIALTLCCGHWRSLQILWGLLEETAATHNNLLPENLLRPAILLDKLINIYPWKTLSTITWSEVNIALYNTLFNRKVHPQSKVLETSVRILTSIIIISQLSLLSSCTSLLSSSSLSSSSSSSLLLLLSSS
jgi:hypothetical protein